MSEGGHRYLIALGGNVRHHRHGSPEEVLATAFERLDQKPLSVLASSSVMQSSPIGPSRRRYANAAALVETELVPTALLRHLKRIEGEFGRKSSGARWSARTLDLDIVLWSGGPWHDPDLTVPHPAFRQRDFVLRPAAMIAREWRDPLSGWTIGQLLHRLNRQGA